MEKYRKIVQQRLRGAIRQVWSRFSEERKEVLYKAKRTKRRVNQDGNVSKKPDVYYVCANCQYEYKLKDIQVDHISPIGKTPDFPGPGWDIWLLRVFCDVYNLQVLCKTCHNEKTRRERGKVHRSKKSKRKHRKKSKRK